MGKYYVIMVVRSIHRPLTHEGFRKDQVDLKGYREAVSLLVVDDARLFVPFYRELSWLSFAEQFKCFAGTNVADATKALLEDIRNL